MAPHKRAEGEKVGSSEAEKVGRSEGEKTLRPSSVLTFLPSSSLLRPPSPLTFLPSFAVLPALLVLVLAGGCESELDRDPMARSYFLSPHKDVRRLGRVVFLELENRSSYPEMAPAVTDALFLETQKRQVFGVVVVHRDDPAWQDLQAHIDSLGALQQLEAARTLLNANGLLVGTVTRYEPYPHLVIGLRLKLIDLADGQILWGLEQVWDSSDRGLRRRIRASLWENRFTGPSPLREELVVISPLNFSKFVAYEVAGTFERHRRR